jgi:hypothetical protein
MPFPPATSACAVLPNSVTVIHILLQFDYHENFRIQTLRPRRLYGEFSEIFCLRLRRAVSFVLSILISPYGTSIAFHRFTAGMPR